MVLASNATLQQSSVEINQFIKHVICKATIDLALLQKTDGKNERSVLSPSNSAQILCR